MKHLLITLLTLASSSALAGNGSGTMGVVNAGLIQNLDLNAGPVIKLDLINKHDIDVTQVVAIDPNGAPVFQSLKIPKLTLTPVLKEALKLSVETNDWVQIQN